MYFQMEVNPDHSTCIFLNQVKKNPFAEVLGNKMKTL